MRTDSRTPDEYDLGLPVFALLLALTGALAFWAVFPVLTQPGPVASWDGPGHLARAVHFEQSLDFERLGIFGLFQGWYLGVPLFHFYPPGFFATVSLLRGLTLGFLSLATATKLLLVLSYVAFPLLIAWLGRRLGLPRSASVLGALLSLSFHGYWNLGLLGGFEVGLYSELFTLPLFVLLWGFTHSCVFGPLPEAVGDTRFARRHSLITREVALGALALAAVFTGNIVISSFVPVLFLLYGALALIWRPRAVFRLATLAAGGTLVAWFWVYPFLKSLPFRGDSTQWSTNTLPGVLVDLFWHHSLFPWPVTLGTALALALIGQRLLGSRPVIAGHLVAVLLAAIVIIISSATFRDFLLPILEPVPYTGIVARVVEQAYTVRSQQFLWTALPLVAGAGLTWPVQAVRRHLPERDGRQIAALALALLIVIGVGAFFARATEIRKNSVVTVQTDPVLAPRDDEVQKIAEELAPLVGPESVVLTHVGEFDAWYPGIDSVLHLKTQARMVGGDQLEAVHADITNVTVTPSALHDLEKLSLLSVDYIVLEDQRVAPPPFATEVFRTKHLRLLSLPNQRSFLREEVGRDVYEAQVRLETARSFELPVQYNPHWKATVNGHSLPLKNGPHGLVQVNLEAGLSQIHLTFEKGADEIAAWFVSLGALAALATSLRISRRFSGRELPRP
ncbi:MAG: hypothetical protein Kow00129_16270 [Thermoleophilia bacterium]